MTRKTRAVAPAAPWRNRIVGSGEEHEAEFIVRTVTPKLLLTRRSDRGTKSGSLSVSLG